MSVEEVRKRAEKAGQAHLLRDWPSLTVSEQEELLTCIQDMDFGNLNSIFQSSQELDETEKPELSPTESVTQTKDMTEELIRTWRSVGLDLIGQGKVAVVLLAGGQGTRLGTNKPKGCFDIGLPSKKCLFQIHSERIRRVQQMALARNGSDTAVLWLYIMTNNHTHKETIDFFEEHQFLGLKPVQVKFFQQVMIPCFTEQGKIVLETNSRVALSPNGNGGVYEALKHSGCLEEMQSNGVECVDCFSVDNLLARVADPLFLGHCWKSNSPCGARVVAKASPEEKVGVFVTCSGRSQVVEYSELPSEMAHARESDSEQLLFNWGNICMHYYTLEFLGRAAEMPLPFHVARKRILSCGSAIQESDFSFKQLRKLPTRCLQGIKLERFIFDVFPFADNVSLMEVNREEQFSPVKNAPGSEIDSPDTARAALLKLHQKWIASAGGVIEEGHVVEVSPLLSYEGEDLEKQCKGKTLPSNTILQHESEALLT